MFSNHPISLTSIQPSYSSVSVCLLEGQHGKAEPFSHKITDLKMEKYGKTLFQNLKMAANALDKSKESLTIKNFSRDTLEKVQELKLKIYELEDIANKFEIEAAKENPSNVTENDFDTRKDLKAQTRHSEINLQGQKNNAERDILEKLDNKKADKKLGTKLIKCKVCEIKFASFVT